MPIRKSSAGEATPTKARVSSALFILCTTADEAFWPEPTTAPATSPINSDTAAGLIVCELQGEQNGSP